MLSDFNHFWLLGMKFNYSPSPDQQYTNTMLNTFFPMIIEKLSFDNSQILPFFYKPPAYKNIGINVEINLFLIMCVRAVCRFIAGEIILWHKK